MRRPRDKAEIRECVVRLAAASWPGTLERHDLDAEPAIARADGRTVNGELVRLVRAGVLSVIHRDPLNGTILRVQATDPAAEAVRALS